jgi:hypothetical protein
LNTDLSEQVFIYRSSSVEVDGKLVTFPDNGAEDIPFESDFCRTALLLKHEFHQVRCDVTCDALTALTMKIVVLWDVTPCSLLDIHRRFE